MTLDLDLICISGVPIAGIAAFSAESARQFLLGDGELVRLPGLHQKVASVVLANAAGDGAPEVAVAKAVEHDLFDPLECFTELRPAGLNGITMERLLRHCA